jgi:hypothetical protein
MLSGWLQIPTTSIADDRQNKTKLRQSSELRLPVHDGSTRQAHFTSAMADTNPTTGAEAALQALTVTSSALLVPLPSFFLSYPTITVAPTHADPSLTTQSG